MGVYMLPWKLLDSSDLSILKVFGRPAACGEELVTKSGSSKQHLTGHAKIERARPVKYLFKRWRDFIPNPDPHIKLEKFLKFDKVN
jgi:hypothetical protein